MTIWMTKAAPVDVNERTRDGPPERTTASRGRLKSRREIVSG